VRSLAIEYLRPAAFNDELAVSVEPAELKGGQIVLEQSIRRGADVIATARVRIVCVNTISFRPVRIPGNLLDSLHHIAQSRRETT
jgi:acyl-CoA thioester hydrolase